MTYILNEAQEAWLKALESGEYKQAQGVLHDGQGYCCLGVACAIKRLKFKKANYGFKVAGCETRAPRSVVKSLKLKSDLGFAQNGIIVNGEDYRSLADANDHQRTFKQIARAIRSNPTAVFKE